MSTSTIVELLSPAGDRECLRAAIENGADAVYFGLDRGFNARARAENMSLENLDEIMLQLHERGVRGYLTLNTLVFSDELAEFERIVRRVAEANVDAVLVQDLGAARLIRAICPDLPIHASTQMTLTSAECIAVAESLGIARVVLPRELSIDEIREITSQTKMPVEVFAHGALCVAYSGQCLTSESLGGRSANRGQCAQACRLPYEIFSDGQHVPLEEQKYLLSPQDLMAYELIPDLVAAGVSSLKIEGRLKTAEYVASITRHYRQAIDEAVAGHEVKLTQDQADEMALTFSRGFAPGWLEGCDHKRLVPATSSAKRGLLVGTIERIIGDRVRVRLRRPVKTGDGVMFDLGREQNEQPGGRIYEIRVNGRRVDQVAVAPETVDATDRARDDVVELTFARDSLPFEWMRPGQTIWKTDDPALSRTLRRTFDVADPQRTWPIDVEIEAVVGQPLRVRAGAPLMGWVEVTGNGILEAARKHPVTEETLREQFSRLGHTPFRLHELKCKQEGSPMVPLSMLGEVRRAMIELLRAAMIERPARTLAAPGTLDELRRAVVKEHDSQPATDTEPRLRVLCRSLPQLSLVLEDGWRDVAVDFADIRQYKEAAEMARAVGARLLLATPRIQKPGEMGIFHAMAKTPADGILARNLAAIQYFVERQIPVVADYSLNAANELTAQFLREQRVDRLTVSYDLNRDQLLHLVASTPASWLEVVVHQHMPMFHMEHCVFCAVLSPGTNKTNCGRPCDDHQVELQDRAGMKHPLTADVGCRNTLFNATAQSGAEVVPELLRAGVSCYRVELLNESTADEVHEVLALYDGLLRGIHRGVDVWKKLKALNRVGVTRGTMESRRDPLAII